MERREFIKKAGLGSIAIASFGGALAEDALGHGGDRTSFDFVALSGQAATLTGGESIAMHGCGDFSGTHVRGGGQFVHFDGKKVPSSEFIATGGWRAQRVLSFSEVGTWGNFVSGILELQIKLLPCEADPIRATLKVVCNLGPAAIFTGQTEGYTLTIPSVTPFSPFSPNIGLTIFSREC